MRRAGRLTSALVGGCMALTVLGAGSLVIASVADASQAMTATTWVNMRSGPSTSNPVVTVLAPSQAVTASGQVSGGWYQVTTDKGQTGWVYQNYLKASESAPTQPSQPAPTDPVPTATGEATTTANVNVRTGPGTSYTAVAVATKGSTLPTTGKTSGGWTQVIHGGQARWISTNYLTTGTVTKAVAAGQLRTTANLYLRTGGSTAYGYTGVLPGNSVVDTTGQKTADYTEIIHGGETRWIATRYTTAVTTTAPAPAPAPTATGTVYVNVGSLYVRATSDPSSTVVATVYRGNELATTGTVVGDRLQVIHNGAARWVFKAYTTSTAPATPLATSVSLPGYDPLNANAKAVVQHILDNYPQIRTIGGYRASSSYSSDHPNGRAVDVMVSNWSQQSSIDYGWTIARDFAANAAEYKITYIIWRQQIWNASYPERGWRWMEDRGGATANHLDHVHISVRD